MNYLISLSFYLCRPFSLYLTKGRPKNLFWEVKFDKILLLYKVLGRH